MIPPQSDIIPCTRRDSLSCPYLSRNSLDITEIHNGGKFLLNRGKAQLLPSPFPFDAISLSYFGRSTCLLRTFNVLTTFDQRAYFVRSKTNSSDFLANPSDLLGKLLESLGKDMRGNLSAHAGKHVLLSDEFVLLRPFNVFTSAVQRAYYGRSTCLLRPK